MNTITEKAAAEATSQRVNYVRIRTSRRRGLGRREERRKKVMAPLPPKDENNTTFVSSSHFPLNPNHKLLKDILRNGQNFRRCSTLA